MSRIFLLAITLTLGGSGSVLLAQEVLITFDSAQGFELGDGLTDINAVVAAENVSFTAIADETSGLSPNLRILADPSGGSNQVLNAGNLPGAADILLNFLTPISSVRVDFVDSPQGLALPVSLTGYGVNGTASSIQSENALASILGSEPDTLQLTGTFLAVQFESNGNQIFIDNISFVPIPEPSSSLLALVGLVFSVRRR